MEKCPSGVSFLQICLFITKNLSLFVEVTDEASEDRRLSQLCLKLPLKYDIVLHIVFQDLQS